MTIFDIFLGISLSADAFGVGISYGAKNIKIPFVSSLIISFMSVIYFFCAQILGKFLRVVLPSPIEKLIGTSIVGGIALVMLIKAFQNDGYDLDSSKSIDKGEAFLLGIALALDSLGAGVAFGLAGCFSIFQPLLIGLFQFLFLSIGLYLGKKIKKIKWITKKIGAFIPGLIMLLLMFAKLFL